MYYEGIADSELAARQRDLSERLRLHASALSVRSIAALPLAANGKISYADLER